MKKFKLSRKAIIILLVSIATLVAIDVALNVGNIFVTGHRMARLENHPILEMRISVDDGMATLRIVNRSEEAHMFGEQFALYRRFGWRWRRVFFANEFTQGVDWFGIGFPVPPNSYGQSWPHNLYERFGELPSGEYRIVKEVSLDDAGRNERTRVAGGFTLP